MFCRLKVRSYVLAANVAGTLKVAPLQILKFPVVLPHKFLDAEKFNLRFSDASEITEIADKLRWYRYQKGLRQRDAADYAGIDRSTYIHYEEAGRDFYPKEHMEKLAELFEVPLEDLLDDYNLFLLRGQGEQIKAIRQRLGLTQKVYAAQLGVPLQKFKRWEQGKSCVIYPIIIDDSVPPALISQIKYLRFNDDEYTSALSTLLRSLRKQFSK